MKTSLSNYLYTLAASRAQESDTSLDERNYQTFRWVWHWLLVNQPTEKLQQELDELAVSSEDDNLNAQFLLELSWKAQAIELLLENHHG
jgi:hypothetical protein